MYLLEEYEIVAELDGLIRVLKRTEDSPEVGYTEDYKSYRQRKLDEEMGKTENSIEENANDENSNADNSNDDNSNVDNSADENYDEGNYDE